MNDLKDKPKPVLTEQESQIIDAAKAFRERLKKAHLVIRAQLPLKVGIHEDVYARYPDVPKEVVDKTLKWLVNERGYVSRMRVGAARVDLDGNDVGEVTTQHGARHGQRSVVGKEDAEKAAKTAAEFAVKKPGVRKIEVKRVPNEAHGDLTSRPLHVSVQVTDFDRLLNLNTSGKEGVRIRLTLPCGSQVSARLNPKSFRKAVEAFKAANGNAAVSISGLFAPADAEITGAGVAVTARTKSPEN